MKSFGIIAASALFSAVVNAAPVNKRAVVWVTETDIAVVTIPVTKTIWAGAEKAVATNSRTRHHFSKIEASTTSSSVVPASTNETSSSAVPTSINETSSTSVYVAPTLSSTSVYVAPTTSSTSVYVAPTTSSTSVYVAPTTSSTSVYVAPTTSSTSVYVAPTTSSTSVYVAPTTSSTSVYVAPTSYVASTTSSAAPAATSSSSSGSGSGLAASGTEYTGDLTWYEVGLGACGETSVSTDHIVAISHSIFDDSQYATANPNDNPLCGRTVSITGKTGSTYKATVVDRCVGCAEADLDLSQDFFNTVTSNGDGRVSGMTWTWD